MNTFGRARRHNGDGAGAFGRRVFLDGNAAGELVVNGAFEFLAKEAGVFDGDARDEDALFAFEELGGDFDDLFGCFAGAKNDFGKILAERAMRVHLGETEIYGGRRLESLQNLGPAHSARSEFFQQFRGFRCGHTANMPRGLRWVTREKVLKPECLTRR